MEVGLYMFADLRLSVVSKGYLSPGNFKRPDLPSNIPFYPGSLLPFYSSVKHLVKVSPLLNFM
jgi:hypothetical protein